MTIDIPALVVGAILLAGLYATMSFGLALIYGVMKIVNLAHAGVMMWGAYATFVFIVNWGGNAFLAPLIIVPLFFLLGIFMQRFIVRRVMYAPPIASLLLLFGVWLIMQNIAYLVFSGDTRAITTAYTLMTFQVAGIAISFNRLIVFCVGILALFLLQQFLNHTYMGKAIRATSQDGDASKLVGINTERVMEIAFGLGIALASLAGSLMALIFAFDPDFGRSHLLKSFCIVVLGGVGSFVGVALGSLVLAISEALSVLWIMPAMQDFVSFALLVIVLIVMPGGIMGLLEKFKKADGTEGGIMQVKAALRSGKTWAGLAFVIFLFWVPASGIAGGYLQTLCFLTFLYVTLSTAWNILGGYAGQTSFGHATFYGLGAYTTAILVLRDVPPLITMPLAGIVAALYALMWGYPCLRLRGQYFAIATIGVGEATRLLMLNLDDLIKNNSLLKGFLQDGVLTGGATGLMLPTPEDIRSYAVGFYYGAMGLMTAALLVSWWVKNSKFGLGLFAINMDIDAAETIGVNTVAYKNLALMLSAFMVGICGSVYTQYMFYIDPQTVFGFPMSIAMVLMPTIGGIGTLAGPILGAVVYIVVQDRILTANLEIGTFTLSLSSMHLLLYGGLLVLIILFEPKGITGLYQRLVKWWKKVGAGATDNRSA